MIHDKHLVIDLGGTVTAVGMGFTLGVELGDPTGFVKVLIIHYRMTF